MIIDAHTHIFPDAFRVERWKYFDKEPAFKMLYGPESSKMAGFRDLIDAMDAEGVDKSVVFGFPWKTADFFKRHNDYIAEAVNHYPDRLIGLSCFDAVSPVAAKEAERCFNAGLSGVGELAVYDSPLTDEIISKLKDVMSVCLEHDAPLLIHTNEPVGHKYPGKQEITLKQIENFLMAYPENKIILAHWGGGIFFYSLLKKEVKDYLENVWFDTAASPYLYNVDIYKTAGEIIGYDKILFGTDYPLLRPSRYFKELESAGIASQDIQKIKGRNASALFGLK